MLYEHEVIYTQETSIERLKYRVAPQADTHEAYSSDVTYESGSLPESDGKASFHLEPYFQLILVRTKKVATIVLLVLCSVILCQLENPVLLIQES